MITAEKPGKEKGMQRQWVLESSPHSLQMPHKPCWGRLKAEALALASPSKEPVAGPAGQVEALLPLGEASRLGARKVRKASKCCATPQTQLGSPYGLVCPVWSDVLFFPQKKPEGYILMGASFDFLKSFRK